MPTYDTRQTWQAPHSAAVAARGTQDATAWERELGQGSVDQDTWLVSFVDILMLLLTLFVLLLAYKNGPEQKTQPAQTVAAAITTPAVPVATRPVQPAAVSSVESAPPRKPMAPVVGMPGMFGLPEELRMPRLMAARDKPRIPDTPARRPVDQLLAKLQDSALRDRVEVTVLPDSVSLEISDSILFAPASAALTESGMQLLDELAATLKTHPYTLSVEGHTDNVPIKTARYPSNWELSSARATEVTRRLIERGIDPARVRAVGYADTHPRADNAGVEGRARNRRVSLVLMESAG